MLEKLDVSEASRISITINLELLWQVQEKKEELMMEILRIGEPLKDQWCGFASRQDKPGRGG